MGGRVLTKVRPPDRDELPLPGDVHELTEGLRRVLGLRRRYLEAEGADVAAHPERHAVEVLRVAGLAAGAVEERARERVVPVALHDGARGPESRVIVAGLDTDFRGEPFGSMPILMAEAENVSKLHAICMVCGDDASRTQRLVNGNPARYDDPVVIVGASEMYEARCRLHHEVPR